MVIRPPKHQPGLDAPLAPRPAALENLAADRIVDADVRDELRAGREPFSLIMAARKGMAPGSVLRVRAIFEPVPLYAVMRRQGLAAWTEMHGSDDWTVWFYDEAAAACASAAAAPGASAGDVATNPTGDVDGDVVVIDVRGLEPPEPMVRTLEALERLAPGATLVQINERVPQFLLPVLEERGFTYDVREQEEGVTRLFIRHTTTNTGI
jgi:TusA-related sulfurtransferase